MDWQNWLWENEKKIFSTWIKAVQKQSLPNYSSLTEQELEQELKSFYHCLAEAIMEDSRAPLGKLEDWMLEQRMHCSASLPELLRISFLLWEAISQTISQTLPPETALCFCQAITPFFEEAAANLSSLFTRAIEETLTDRLSEAEFLASRLAEATEEADRALVRLKALYEISRALSSTLDLEKISSLVVEKLADVIRADHCALWLAEKDYLKAVASYGLGEEERDFLQPIPLAEAKNSLIGLAFMEGRPLHANWGAEEKFTERSMADHLGVTYMLAVPLAIQDRAIGAVTLDSHASQDPFSAGESDLVESIARQAAVAIENARLYSEIRAHSEQLEEMVRERTRELATEKERMESLYTISRELSASLDLDRVLGRTLNMVTEAVGVHRGCILLLDPITENLVYRAVLGGRSLPRGGEPSPFRREIGLAGWVLETLQPAIVEDVTQDERWLPLPESGDVRSALAVPLEVGGDVHGVLTLVDERPGYFTEEHLKLVSAVASQVSTAINNAELYRFVSEQAERLGKMLRTQQEEASKSQSILESIADGVIVNDSQGHIILVNPAAERILSIRAENLLGQDVRRIFAAFEFQGWSEALRAMDILTASLSYSADPTPHTMQTILEMDNKVVSAHLAPVVTHDDEFLGVVTVFRDITKEVEADRAKSEFVSTVSHELRTPMTSIKGYTDLLFMEVVGRLNEDQKRFLEIIKSNADRLTMLINDLLDISRIETGRVKLELQPLKMEDVVREVVSSLQGQIEKENQTLTLKVPSNLGLVLADRDRLAQILTNLVSNANQYTPKGGNITISLSRAEDTIRVDISDTGIGIPLEEQGKVFERFYRGSHPVVQQSSGTGLGLSIVKMFVEMHNGRIWVDSEPGKGSTFTFILPICTEGQSREAKDETTLKVCKVLVVDGKVEAAEELRHYLEEDGYHVIAADLSSHVPQLFEVEKPDLVILDISSSDAEGLKVLRQLKATSRDIPVIVLSDHRDEEQNRQCLEAGAMDLLTKPVDREVLLLSLETALFARGRVLVVDKDQDLVDLLRLALMGRKFAVDVARDSSEAILIASRRRPSLILLDMPDMGSYEALSCLKRDKMTWMVPVMVILSHVRDEEEERGKLQALGAEDLVVRPFTIEGMLAQIERVLTSKK